ncbi:putative membrane protein [Escherichia coli 2-005-03_S4_C2]|nr:putative membrane protein [Escherichia coli 2-005-03_S4_C2]KDT27402.1 putative membrane protein [Escherichia coli 2-052-05_S4_C1]
MASISFWISSLFIYHFGRVIILCTINSNVAMLIYLAVN